jgi:methionyl-tRNA formyltransferase
MGTPSFAVPTLVALHKHHEVLQVWTQPDRPWGRGLKLQPSEVKKKALELGLPILQPHKMKEGFESLQGLDVDCMVVAAYGQLLKSTILQYPRWGCVNLHASLLPRWRGASPIQSALLYDDVTGVTSMQMTEALDAGGILLQESLSLNATDTSETIQSRLAEVGAELMVQTLEGLGSGALQPKAQDPSQVTYAPKLEKKMAFLNPQEPAAFSERKVRAFHPWPGTHVKLGGKCLKIKKASLFHESIPSLPPGTLFEFQGKLLWSTSEGCLEFVRLQWEGKKEIDSLCFLQGYHRLPKKTDA